MDKHLPLRLPHDPIVPGGQRHGHSLLRRPPRGHFHILRVSQRHAVGESQRPNWPQAHAPHWSRLRHDHIAVPWGVAILGASHSLEGIRRAFQPQRWSRTDVRCGASSGEGAEGWVGC